MKFKSLEAFRGLAALFVILFHSLFTTSTLSYFRINSQIFVDFFFILSGFIISYAYLSRVSKRQVLAKEFFLKRVFRLYPLHLFMLSIWLVYILLKHLAFTYQIGGKDPFETHSVLSFFQHLFLVQSWGTGNIMSWNVPSWSVSVEMMAYTLFFIFVIVVSKISNIGKLLLSLLFVLLFKFLLYSSSLHLDDFAFLLNGLSAFFMGIIVYLLYTYKLTTSISVLFANIIEVTLLTSIFLILNSGTSSTLMINGIQVIFAITIYIFAVQEKGIVSKILQHKIFQYLGLLSYSIYMIHAIVVEMTGHIFEYILKVPATHDDFRKTLILDYADIINFSMIVVIIILAHFTYRYIEQSTREKLNSKLKNPHAVK